MLVLKKTLLLVYGNRLTSLYSCQTTIVSPRQPLAGNNNPLASSSVMTLDEYSTLYRVAATYRNLVDDSKALDAVLVR